MCPQLAATLDVFPTVAKLAGAKIPDVTMDGFDMAPILFDNGKVNSLNNITINSNLFNNTSTEQP